MRLRSAAALAALALSTFVFVTAESLPIGLLAPIARGLGVPQTSVGLLVTGYAGVVVVATIPLTRLTRKVPRRALMAVLLAVFVAGNACCAVSDSYAALLSSRLLVAVAQALLWAVVFPAAASLVDEPVQGRAVAVVNAGSALGPVLGVPAGTYIGQLLGWQSAFLFLAALGLVVLIGVLVSLPPTPATADRAERGSDPDRIRFMTTVLVTGLAVTGAYTVFTYVTPFVDSVTDLPASKDGALLLLRGIAGFAGAVLVGLAIDRVPWVTVVVIVTLQTIALSAQWLFGASPDIAITSIAIAGLTLSALAGANGARILRYAPGNTASASAAVSTAFNVGIMLGALAGSITEATIGIIAVPFVGAAVTLLSALVSAAEPSLARRFDARRAGPRGVDAPTTSRATSTR